MKGLTKEELKILENNLSSTFDYDTAVEIDDRKLQVIDVLVKRGLLIERYYWAPKPNDSNYEILFHYWDVTQLGKLALYCHRAVSQLMVLT